MDPVRRDPEKIKIILFQTSFDRKTCFLKIHAPEEVINRGGENLGIMKPTKDYILTYYSNTLMDMVRSDFNLQMALPVSYLLPGIRGR